MDKKRISLPQIAKQAGVSEVTARRYLRGYNPNRASRGHHYITPEEAPEVLALIASKQQRRCRNAFNSVPISTEGAA